MTRTRIATAGAEAKPVLERPLAFDRHAVHDAALAVVVVDRVVLDAAVVPERDRVLFPTEAAGEFGAHGVFVKVVEERCAFLLGHALEAYREAAVDIEAFLAAPRMGADDRMVDLAVGLLGKMDAHRGLALVGPAARVEAI